MSDSLTILNYRDIYVRGQMRGDSNTLSGYTNYTGISLSDNLLFLNNNVTQILEYCLTFLCWISTTRKKTR